MQVSRQDLLQFGTRYVILRAVGKCCCSFSDRYFCCHKYIDLLSYTHKMHKMAALLQGNSFAQLQFLQRNEEGGIQMLKQNKTFFF